MTQWHLRIIWTKLGESWYFYQNIGVFPDFAANYWPWRGHNRYAEWYVESLYDMSTTNLHPLTTSSHTLLSLVHTSPHDLTLFSHWWRLEQRSWGETLIFIWTAACCPKLGVPSVWVLQNSVLLKSGLVFPYYLLSILKVKYKRKCHQINLSFTGTRSDRNRLQVKSSQEGLLSRIVIITWTRQTYQWPLRAKMNYILVS